MAIRPIELLGSEVLRTRGEEVTEFDDELRALVDDMFATMYQAEGVGLAAPQIGLSRRIFVVHVPDDQDEGEPGFSGAFVNPRIVEASKETEKAPEGCLSIPGLEGVVERATTVVVEAQDVHGERFQVQASGLVARAFQHEYDHIEGVLFLDRLGPLKRRMLLDKWKKIREEAAEEAQSGAS